MNNALAIIFTLREWLSTSTLTIPHYQRPYKWSEKQVLQLLRDIEKQAQVTAQEEGPKSYRMGTVVVHVEQESGKHNIVDGQQRTVTLLLILHALRKNFGGEGQPPWSQELFEPQFSHAESHRNVQTNYAAIERYVRQAGWGKAQVEYLLERCEVVRVELRSLTEAFQFFDAQNGRGKSLRVHDLLKAFHLRALRPAELAWRTETVKDWEACDSDELERLFALFLFQTRQRSRNLNAEYFGKRHVDVFKGISLDDTANIPMSRAWQMLDDATHQLEVHSAHRGQAWPSQLDAPVINGLRFFDWVQHYLRLGFHIRQSEDQLPFWTTQLKSPLTESANDILRQLGCREYKGRHRKGDTHVRVVFDALLMYYLDKFGEQHLSQAVVLAFVWTYIRLLDRKVVWGSMDKYVRESEVNPFAVLRDAVRPQDFLSISLPIFEPKNDPLDARGLKVIQDLVKAQLFGTQNEDGGKNV